MRCSKKISNWQKQIFCKNRVSGISPSILPTTQAIYFEKKPHLTKNLVQNLIFYLPTYPWSPGGRSPQLSGTSARWRGRRHHSASARRDSAVNCFHSSCYCCGRCWRHQRAAGWAGCRLIGCALPVGLFVRNGWRHLPCVAAQCPCGGGDSWPPAEEFLPPKLTACQPRRFHKFIHIT